MKLDDRLRTVLGVAVDGERAALAQYRQLVDLLGSGGTVADGQLVASAFLRLSVLSRRLSAAERIAILREPGLRLRAPSLVAQLCEGDVAVAQAAIDSAELDAEGWDAVIPMLRNGLGSHAEARRQQSREREQPVPAEPLELRPEDESRDEPIRTQPASDAVKHIGEGTVTVPAPVADRPAPTAVPRPGRTRSPAASANGWRRPPGQTGTADIASLVQRIEEYREQRANRTAARDSGESSPIREPGELRVAIVDCRIGPDGRIGWAGSLPSLLTGLTFATADEAGARIDKRSATALRRQQVVRAGEVSIDTAPAIAGRWRLDAVPRFDSAGRFLGHHARLTRQPARQDDSDPRGDEVRQALHELRTPLNAIQGFAEIIQQQLFGDVPNRYRAQAAYIAAESARLLAGLEEVERLVRMRKGRTALTEGETALAALLGQLVDQFAAIEQGEGAKFVLDAPGTDVVVPVEEHEAETMLWRLLATLSAAAEPGERLDAVLRSGGHAELAITLPRALRDIPLFDARLEIRERGEPLLGMLGAGFALRLAAAEMRAAGGSFGHDDERVVLRLPMAQHRAEHSASAA